MPRSPTVPRYRLHKPTDLAVVTVRTADGGRRDVNRGKFNSPETRQASERAHHTHAPAPLMAVLALKSVLAFRGAVAEN